MVSPKEKEPLTGLTAFSFAAALVAGTATCGTNGKTLTAVIWNTNVPAVELRLLIILLVKFSAKKNFIKKIY